MTGAALPARTALLSLALAAARPAPAAAQAHTLDAFDTVSAWSARPSDGVSLRIGTDSGRTGAAMRLDFDFHGGAGYAIAHRTLPLALPDNYEFSFWVRGHAPPENLEFKLIDSSGDNVWWHVQRDYRFGDHWTRLRYRARDIAFAWGPAGGGVLHHVAAIEIVITAGQGGRGTVWVDDLAFRPLPPERPYDLTPVVAASSSAPGHGARLALDGDTATSWRSDAAGSQWLTVDFLRDREYGGLTIAWAPEHYARDYDVDTSADGTHWATAHAVRGGDGGRDYIPLRDGESRWLRIAMRLDSGGDGYAIREVTVHPPGWADSANTVFRSVAADSPRGSYPRYFSGQQSYWTVVGLSGGRRNALLDEDGMLESDRASFSIEPFLHVGGRLITWANATARQSLAEGYLPIPSVEWTAGGLSITITAVAAGTPDAAAVVARYRVRNSGAHAVRATLLLAIRPFQVNPPWQFLNVPGGVAPIHSLARRGRRVVVNGDRSVIALTAPSAFGAASFDEGGIATLLREGRVPSRPAVEDSLGWAEGALAFALELPPGGWRDVAIEIPFPPSGSPARGPAAPLLRDDAGVERLLAASEREWMARLGRVSIELPPAAMDVVRTLHTSVAYMLVNRVGPRIQPGSRAYSRAWIRDGALIGEALLRLGHPEPVRAFAEWYAPYQYASGKVPCCVDDRGADPVSENDSNGEFLFLVTEYWRYTHDRAFLARMWPHLARAVAWIDTLRAQRMTPPYRAPDSAAFYGLLPQSISHEGYSAKPMHSYWDDFFALRGLGDAAVAAAVLGRRDDARRIAATRDAFRADILASLRRAMAAHHIDYLPGSVELGDFDPTSTTIAVAPGGELANLPEPALRRTFERYWEAASRRPDSTEWEAYTPYEMRAVGTMVRLGWPGRAQRLLSQFLGDRRPAAWNQWAEVVWREPRAPRFIGDMPHTWVASDYVRSVLDCFAYGRPADSALVVGAGIPAAWVDTAPGVVVRGLRTPYGPLDLIMRGDGGTVTARVGGGLVLPRGGVVLASPYDRPARSATVNGASVPVSADGRVVLRRLPAVVVFR